MAVATIETELYSVSSEITDYLKDELGYSVPVTAMQPHIQKWESMYRCAGKFWAWEEPDGAGRLRSVERLTVKPAKRVCKEMASLIMDGDMRITVDNEEANEWLQDFINSKGFIAKGQDLIQRSCALGTGAWVLWLNAENGNMQIRRMFGTMVIPLNWDEDGITECAFATRAQVDGKALDQLQIHRVADNGNYVIDTVFFDIESGKKIAVEGVEPEFDTKGSVPWFAVFTPSGDNDIVEFSPYGRSIFADSIDILKAVDIAWDAEFGEVRTGKRLMFLSDGMIQVGTDSDGKPQYKAFSSDESGMYRIMGTVDDMVKDFAPTLRIDGFSTAYKDALSQMGDSMGFGADYFVPDRAAGMRTAKEVASVQSQLMRNIAKHEEKAGDAIRQIIEAVIHCARTFTDASLPENIEVTVEFDDSIIEDTDTEKANDQAEVTLGLMPKYQYLMKWHGLDEETAREWVAESQSVTDFAGFEE